jgi:hypothetical protein
LTGISEQLRKSDELFKNIEEKRLDQIAKQIHSAWRRAMEELLCDMACVELFGPAAILAMRAFAACSPPNEMPSPATNFYPPHQYRFEVVWKYSTNKERLTLIYEKCADKEPLPFFKAEMESFERQASLEEGSKLAEKHPLAKIAYKYVNSLLPKAKQFVDGALPMSIVRWYDTKVIDQVDGLLARIQKGIPPNELILSSGPCEDHAYETEPAQLDAILIAGWIYETFWQRSRRQTEHSMSYSTLSRLLLKACEDIELMGSGG